MLQRPRTSLPVMVLTLLPHYETTDVRIEKVVVGPFENNVFVLRSKSSGDAVIIDAANEHELLLDVSRRTGVRRVLTTHGHFDHIQAVTQMRDAGIDVGIAAEDAKMLPSYDFVIPDDDVIEQLRGPADQIFVTLGNGVERSGIDDSQHGMSPATDASARRSR